MESLLKDKSIVAEKPTIHRITVVAILFITLLIAYLDRVNVSVLLADNNFLVDMGIKGQAVQMGMLMSVFLLAYGTSNILLSPLGDKLGPRKAMCISILLWAVALLMGGWVSTFSLMLMARVILGVGEGMHWPMNSKYVKNWFPPVERGKANSIWLLGVWIGPALAMPLFTWILPLMGWRNSFFSLSAIGFLPLILLWYFTTDRPSQNKYVNKAELEFIESGLKAEAELESTTEQTTFWETAKVFVFDYHFWLVCTYYLTSTAIFWGMMAWLPSYLKVARGFSWSDMGMLSALPLALGAVCVLVFGYLSDKAGRRAPFCAAAGLICTIALWAGVQSTDNLTAALLISVGVAAIGVGQPSVWTLLQQIVPGKAIGTGAGLMNGITNAGSALTPILIGYFIALTGGYIGGIMVLVGFGAIATVSMLILAFQKY